MKNRISPGCGISIIERNYRLSGGSVDGFPPSGKGASRKRIRMQITAEKIE